MPITQVETITTNARVLVPNEFDADSVMVYVPGFEKLMFGFAAKVFGDTKADPGGLIDQRYEGLGTPDDTFTAGVNELSQTALGKLKLD